MQVRSRNPLKLEEQISACTGAYPGYKLYTFAYNTLVPLKFGIWALAQEWTLAQDTTTIDYRIS
jgi:hypothetical protein